MCQSHLQQHNDKLNLKVNLFIWAKNSINMLTEAIFSDTLKLTDFIVNTIENIDSLDKWGSILINI